MNKIIEFSKIKLIKQKYKSKKIGLCHGVFDILHFGHLQHFKSAKKICDILVVSITSDKHINKGPNRPYSNTTERANFLSAIEIIDYVVVSHDYTPVKILNELRPNFYIKGNEYKNLKKDYTKNILIEKKTVSKIGAKIFYTNEKTKSSSKIINKYLSNFDDSQKKILRQISKKFNFDDIFQITSSFKNKKVMIIGEPIFDEYTITRPQGLGSKSAIISTRYVSKEKYNGGSVAIANNFATLGCSVLLIMPYSNLNELKTIKKLGINSKVKLVAILFKNWQIPIKNRFVNEFRYQKIYEINHIKELYPSKKEINKFLSVIKTNIKKYDIITIADFGHSLFEDQILMGLKNTITNTKKFVSLNVQTNSYNFGFNTLRKYNDTNFNFLSIDEKELRLAFSDRYISLEKLIKREIKNRNLKNCFSITLGDRGSVYVDEKSKMYYCPIFFKDIFDTTGAGDTYLVMSTLLSSMNIEPTLNILMSNTYAGLNTLHLANKKQIGKEDLLRSLQYLLK